LSQNATINSFDNLSDKEIGNVSGVAIPNPTIATAHPNPSRFTRILSLSIDFRNLIEG
jgi:hypothetical protein